MDRRRKVKKEEKQEKSPHLSSSVHLVGEFDFVERHRRLHPVSAEVRRVRVDVDAAVAAPLAAALRPAGSHPLPVHELPSAAVGRNKVQQEGVHGAGVQTRHTDLQDREHPAARISKILFHIQFNFQTETNVFSQTQCLFLFSSFSSLTLNCFTMSCQKLLHHK